MSYYPSMSIEEEREWTEAVRNAFLEAVEVVDEEGAEFVLGLHNSTMSNNVKERKRARSYMIKQLRVAAEEAGYRRAEDAYGLRRGFLNKGWNFMPDWVRGVA